MFLRNKNNMWKSEDEMMNSNLFIMYDYREKDSDFGYSRTTAWFKHRLYPYKQFHYTHVRSHGRNEHYTFRTDLTHDPMGTQFTTFNDFAKYVEQWLAT